MLKNREFEINCFLKYDYFDIDDFDKWIAWFRETDEYKNKKKVLETTEITEYFYLDLITNRNDVFNNCDNNVAINKNCKYRKSIDEFTKTKVLLKEVLTIDDVRNNFIFSFYKDCYDRVAKLGCMAPKFYMETVEPRFIVGYSCRERFGDDELVVYDGNELYKNIEFTVLKERLKNEKLFSIVKQK